MAKHRHHWSPGTPGFENCVSCGAKRPSRAQPVNRGLPQDRQPPKPDPDPLGLSVGLFKDLEAERLRQVREREENIKALLSRPVRNSWIGVDPAGNPEQIKMREPTPEEALQVIFDYLEFVADEKGVDGLRTVAGMWMSKVTNGISDIVRKHEDKEGG